MDGSFGAPVQRHFLPSRMTLAVWSVCAAIFCHPSPEAKALQVLRAGVHSAGGA